MGSSLGTTDYSVHSLPLISHSTDSMAWHKGTWWPLYVKEWYGPRCSQHMFDPYSFCLLVLGLFLHLLWGTDNIGNWVFGFVAAVLVELVWELIGNSSFILKRIKQNSGTSGEYNGDSIQNILGDILSCSLGYIIGTLFAALDFWWLSILLAIVTLLVHSQRLRGWQCAKIPRSDSGKYF